MQWKTAGRSTKKYKFSGKIVKQRDCNPFQDLKWINFNIILGLNEATFLYKNHYGAADSNVKNIKFDLKNKASRRINRNGSDEPTWGKKLSLY